MKQSTLDGMPPWNKNGASRRTSLVLKLPWRTRSGRSRKPKWRLKNPCNRKSGRSERRKWLPSAIEEKNKDLVALSTANARAEADSKAYAIAAAMKALAGTDPKTLQVLTSVGMEPGQLVALAFKELAERSDKIGQLSMSEVSWKPLGRASRCHLIPRDWPPLLLDS
jgi:hypothetical protein